MAASRFNNQQYKNWLRGTLALQHLKEGIEDFIDYEASNFHVFLQKDIDQTLPACSGICTSRDICKRGRHGKGLCSTCNSWFEESIKYHVDFPNPQLSPENTDPQLWPTNAWELVKLYMSFGCKRTKRAKDADAQAILSLLKNCEYFWKKIGRRSLVEELLSVRNALCHSGYLAIEDADLLRYMKTLLEFLQQMTGLTDSQDRQRKDAIEKIEQLQANKIDMSLNKELELSALFSHQKEMESDLKERIEKIEKWKGDQDTELTTLKQVIDELKTSRDRLQDFLEKNNLVQDISRLSTSLRKHEQRLNAQDKTLQEHTEKQHSLDKTLHEHKDEHDALDKTLQEHKDKHDALDKKLQEHKEKHDTLDKTLQEHKEKQHSLDNTLQEHKEKQHSLDKTQQEHKETLDDHDTRLHKLETVKPEDDAPVACSTQSWEDQCKGLRAILIQHYKATCLVVPNPAETNDVGLEYVYVDTAFRVLRESKGRDGLKNVKDSVPRFSYRKLFYTEEYQSRQIYITGDAGSGKTMMCKNIVRLWCEAHGLCLSNEPEDCESDSDEYESRQVRKQRQEEINVRREDNRQILSQFTLLFYIILGDSPSEYSVTEMIQSQVLKYHDAVKGLSPSVLLKHERCLIIVDGLDEWVCPVGAHVPRFLNSGIPGRDIFNQQNVFLTTTRPWKLDVLQLKSSEVDKHVELCELSETSVSQICSKVVKLLNKSQFCRKSTSDFFRTLEQKGLALFKTIPVLLIQLICLWFDNKELGKSQVQMYCAMLDLLLERSKKNLLVKATNRQKV